MSTQVLLDHDLNANAHRILGARGSDVTIANGLVTLGNGNLFRIIPGQGSSDDELQYITTAGWQAGSVVYLEVTRDEDSLVLTNGGSPPSGAAPLVIRGDSSELNVGQVAVLSFDGDDWKLVNIISGGVSGNFQPIGDGGNLAVSNYAITLPAFSASKNFFTAIAGGAGGSHTELGAIVTPSSWPKGSTIYIQAPGNNSVEIPKSFESETYDGVAIGSWPVNIGPLTGSAIVQLVFNGNWWEVIASNASPPA